MTKLTPKSEPHEHDYKQKVRFKEKMTPAHDSFDIRRQRKFIGYRCECGKVITTDIEKE